LKEALFRILNVENMCMEKESYIKGTTFVPYITSKMPKRILNGTFFLLFWK